VNRLLQAGSIGLQVVDINTNELQCGTAHGVLQLSPYFEKELHGLYDYQLQTHFEQPIMYMQLHLICVKRRAKHTIHRASA
jgi:hypothetical protein